MRGLRLEVREEREELGLMRFAIAPAELRTGPLDGLVEAIIFEGFEEIIERVNFKSADGVFIVRGHEHDQWPAFDREFREDPKAIEPGHLHVEKNKIGGETLDRGHSLASVRAFADDFDIGFVAQKARDQVAGGWFVIDD